MKNLMLFLFALLVTAVIVGCDSDNGDDKKTVCKILSEFVERTENVKEDYTEYAEYVYDTISGNLVQINYSRTSTSDVYSYDTLIYNTSDQLVTIENWEIGSDEADETYTFTYTSGKITKIVETGSDWDDELDQEVPYTSTIDITYNGDAVATITSSGGRDNMAFKDITYSGGNLNTVEVDFFGNDSIWVGMQAQSFDEMKNISKYLVPDWENILFGSSDNNMLLLVTTDSVHMGDRFIDIGDTIFNQSYTYNMYDQVLTLTQHPSAMEDGTLVRTYTWECNEE